MVADHKKDIKEYEKAAGKKEISREALDSRACARMLLNSGMLHVSPGSMGTACPLSGRNSTYRPVQILEAGSVYRRDAG